MEHALGAMLGRRLLVSHSAARLPIVWDEDVADAAISAMKRRARGAFNLSASEPLPMEGLARAAGMRYARVPKRLVYALSDLRVQLAARGLVRSAEDPSWVRSGEAPAVFSTERARRELGWSPRCETAADVVRRYAEVVPSRPDPRVALFMRAVDLAGALGPEVPELAGLAARVRLELTGRGGGVFGLIVEGNRARVRAGAPRAPTAALTLKTSLFLDLLAGRADFTTAQVTGQLRVEGEVLNAMLLGGMITMFRAGAERKGLRGALVRRAGAWFAQGVG
jgi:putative sterol carrier protein